MLSFDISERTVLRWMRKAPRDSEPAKRWAEFLNNHREAIATMDFFTVPSSHNYNFRLDQILPSWLLSSNPVPRLNG